MINLATIYDIARHAGVSIATVSRVINNRDVVSEKTKRRVEVVMKELDYSPSILAAAMSNKRTYTFGLMIPDIVNPFFAQIVRGVEDEGNKYGFNVIICNTDNSTKKEKAYVDLMMQKLVDGLIFASTEMDNEVIRNLANNNYPLVLIAREIRDQILDAVLVDNQKGAYEATTYLIGLGHRHIAAVCEPLRIKSSLERLEGYQQALSEAGLDPYQVITLDTPSTLQMGKYSARRLLELPVPPTAVFAVNDLLAIGIIRELKDSGQRVPEDISVVGFDDTIMAEVSDPPLTTIAQPIYEMGTVAAQKLVRRLQTGDQYIGQRTVLETRLVVRKSAAAIK